MRNFRVLLNSLSTDTDSQYDSSFSLLSHHMRDYANPKLAAILCSSHRCIVCTLVFSSPAAICEHSQLNKFRSTCHWSLNPTTDRHRADVHYLLRGGGLVGEFRLGGVSLILPGSRNTSSQVRMCLLDARKDAAISGVGALTGHTNYLFGSDPARWLRGLPNYFASALSQCVCRYRFIVLWQWPNVGA